MPESPILLNTLETHGLQLTTLLKELEEEFPLTNPNPSMDMALIFYRAGQRSVVEHIQSKLSDNG